MKNTFRARLALLLALLMLSASGCASQGDAGSGSSSAAGESSTSSGPQTTAQAASNPSSDPSLPQKEYTQKDLNDQWAESDCTVITLSGSTAAVQGSGASVTGGVLTISKGGDYLLSGEFAGQILVNADKTDDVRLILDGVSVTSDSAPLWVQQADKVILTLAEGSENAFTDGSSRDESAETIPNAALYSQDDLSINGSGSLTVTASYDHGIFCKNDLTITGGSISVTAPGDGVKGKDSFAMLDGVLTIEAGQDGIQASETDDSADGWVRLDGGSISITAGQDGIQAETVLWLIDGQLDMVTGGGSHADGAKADNPTDMMGGKGGMGGFGGGRGGFFPGSGNDTGSAPAEDAPGADDAAPPEGATPPEGMPDMDGSFPTDGARPDKGGRGNKMPEGEVPPEMPSDGKTMPDMPGGAIQTAQSGGAVSPMILPTAEGDTAEAESVSDSMKGLKAGTLLQIDGGSVSADCLDDTVHCNGDVVITGGVLSLSSGDDGVHADNALTISGGELTVSRSYEGLEGLVMDISDGILFITAADDGLNAAGGNDSSSGFGMFGRDNFADGSASLTISGGRLTVDAGGDGLDSNGQLTVSGGTVLVAGPTNSGNGALDFGGSCSITGGTLIASGSAGMDEVPREASQPTLRLRFRTAIEPGTAVAIADESGSILCAFVSSKQYNSLILSLPQLTEGSTYRLLTGCTVTGAPSSGSELAALYDGSSCQGGTQVQTFTAQSGVSELTVG